MYNEIIAVVLASTEFHHILRLGEVKGHSALLSALVERWRPETHTFHLSVGEMSVTLEDITHILGLTINRDPVIGRMESSLSFLVETYIETFGRQPDPHDHTLGKVNLIWARQRRDIESLDIQESIERYV
ncbi:hypothetical protein Ahy_A07g034597 isoform A [Arachis hypogaea]|uniref:Aminotransferase-like plant mobile domain-containing protein n=1 Tax=Arachis hypogaea TaxID=3818 RepID=A0A445CC88_ARAHY|nr:hypothetical protein Ahy_A07g034597 isoform A [Arachis hypogaea]